MPVFLSTVYSCGIACSSSRSCGIACARATSFARSTSDFVDLVAVHRDDALARHRLHVLAGDAGVHLGDLRARHPLGVLQRLPDRARRLLDVGDDAAAHARRARLADAEDLDGRMLRQVADDFGDDGGRLGRADVESGDEAFRIHCSLAITWSR